MFKRYRIIECRGYYFPQRFDSMGWATLTINGRNGTYEYHHDRIKVEPHHGFRTIAAAENTMIEWFKRTYINKRKDTEPKFTVVSNLSARDIKRMLKNGN